MMTKRGVAVFRLHSGHPPSQRSAVKDDGDAKAPRDTLRDSLHTMAPMFTADKLVSFQQL